MSLEATSKMIDFSLLLICFVTASTGLRLVSYDIPSVVDFRDEVTLWCQFDGEQNDIHTVRWFVNGTEFFRSSPAGNVFHYVDGISVRMHKSNQTAVTLAPLYFTTSGDFRCEASTAPPLYRTLSITKQMTVVALPKSAPVIEGIHPSHRWGADLELNCTTPPSYPAADVQWTINGQQYFDTRIYDDEEDSGMRIRSTKVGVRLRTAELPFGDDAEVIVSCVAFVPGIYTNTVSLRLAKAMALKTSY